MKRLSTFITALIALLALPLMAHAEEDGTTLFDFQKNNLNLTVGTSAAEDGNLSGQDIVNGDVTMRATSGGTMHARYYYLASRGSQLQVIKDGRLRFTAAEGKVITKIEFRLPNTQINWKLDKGGGKLSTDKRVWEGAATSVRLQADGPCYIDSILVTTATVVTPEPDEYTEVASIAEFNQLADGTLAKLALNDAQVTAVGVDGWTTYVQDATGAAHFYLLDQPLKAGDVLSGYVLVTKYTQTGNNRIGVSEDFSAETYTVTQTEPTVFEGTIAEVKTTENLNRLVKISGVKFSAESKTKGTATDSEGNTIVVYNGTSGMSPYAIEGDLQSYAKATITGILYNVSAGLQIYPLSIEEEPVIFDFSSETIRENIGTALTDTKGYIYNETFTVDQVTLQVTAGSAPSRIYKDGNRGQNLVTYKDYATLTFKAPEGYALTKIEFTAAGTSNIKNFTASSGTIEDMTWTGNADGVRFAQGGTSYLANAIVTLATKDDATTALPAIEYTDCANIAAFNALEAGTYAKVTLTDAEVIGKSADGYSTVWIQDATGGCWIQYTSLNDKLKEQTKVNGTVYVVARPNSGNVQMKEAENTLESEIAATDISDYTIVEGTLEEVNVAANLNKVVKLSGATLEETSATAGKLTLGDATIDVNNGAATANQQLHKIEDWAKDTKLENVTIVAILVGKSATANQLLPISIEEAAAAFDVEVSNIAEFNAVEDGKVVKLALNNARVNAYNDLNRTYYIEDATGATAIKGISLTKATALNGYIVGKKGTEDVDYVNTPSQGYEYSLKVEDATLSDFEATATELTGTPMTITEAAVQANYGRLVTLSNIDIAAIGNGFNKQLTDADGNTIKARDLFGVLPADYTWPEKAASVTGVVLFYMTGWFIMPISVDGIVAGSTDSVSGIAAMGDGPAEVYNLQGVRQDKLQKGLNIVNGKKVVVKK